MTFAAAPLYIYIGVKALSNWIKNQIGHPFKFNLLYVLFEKVLNSIYINK